MGIRANEIRIKPVTAVRKCQDGKNVGFKEYWRFDAVTGEFLGRSARAQPLHESEIRTDKGESLVGWFENE
jgi:hypothetical protein